jgi:ribonuclease VapC
VIVDTSALVAITFAEPGHQNLIAKLVSAPSAGIGTPTLAETGLVLAARLGRDPRDLVIRLLDEFGIEQVPFGDHHWREAIDAYLQFGKGRHKARLNLGDCLTYAVARLANEPLLFTGDDFPHTDLVLA